ncbi:RiPP maturation radical SAM C-methyltransferase [Actinomadura sp. 6N118]|uniref:RiPP maturation radical SAM C-methyltransferase n=1 Tax=Actinomadura sp. 6N118 TaxID=3375151 RepID=UPI0037B97150
MRLVLAAMPWQAVHRPSLPVGLLHSLVSRDCPGVEVTEYHGGIRWAEHLFAADGTVPSEYTEIADTGVFHGLGDLIFSGSLYEDPDWEISTLRSIAGSYGFDAESVMRMRAHASGFIDAAADEILASRPAIVGFSTTFMQNVPSLALARRLKERRPDLLIVFGGANCDGPMGHALHRNHRFVDLVVRGEGEQVFPALLTRLGLPEAQRNLADVPGLCWWNGDRSTANPQPTHSVPPSVIPIPDYDGWQEVFERSPLREYLSPELVLESSRGCWWGEKHHCTFCGLNGSTMAFRSKPADQFWTELSTLVERHQILDVVTVDNILDMEYFKTLLPQMTEADWDLRVFYEIKSNLRAEQIAALGAAGVVLLQPGIESLSGRVLKLMDKGVDGATNVRLLRDCEDNDITCDWNYLYGFPGESAADYWQVIDQIPALLHLQPPSYSQRIVLERFSPYFDRPDLGFERREPAAFYRKIYDLPDDELADLVYFFDCDDAGITGEVVVALTAALDRWRRDYPHSSLLAEDRATEILITEGRVSWPPARHRLTGWQADAYRALNRRRTINALCAHLAERGHDIDRQAVVDWLQKALNDGLVFVDGTAWVALATAQVPLKVGGTGCPRERE